MRVSLICVAYNEESYLPQWLECLKQQEFPHEEIELIFVDSVSKDATRRLMEDFAKDAASHLPGYGFADARVYSNPKKYLPAGINVALAHAKGELIVRIDAHASFPPDFIAQSVRVIDEGHDAVGGCRPTVETQNTAWSETLWMLEESLFGSSIAAYRRAPQAGPVSSVFHGMYKREIFEEVGLYDERLHRIEDNDMSYRIRKAGYEIWFDPRIQSRQFIRSSFSRMLKQKYGNGLWIGKGLIVEPGCLSWHHLIPALFLVGLLLSVVLVLLGIPYLLYALVISYGALALLVTLDCLRKIPTKSWYLVVLPLLLFILHLSYGVGTWWGVISAVIHPLPKADTSWPGSAQG